MSDTGLIPLASLVPAGFDEHRIAGRSLSVEQAADLALRVLDEELALAATPAAGGGSEAAEEAHACTDGNAFRRRGGLPP